MQSKRAVQTGREASVETELGGQTEGKKVCLCVYKRELQSFIEKCGVCVCVYV